MSHVTEAVASLSNTCRKYFQDFLENLRRDFKMRELPPDGTVHEATANV
jgi:hypothetical protein